MIDVCIGKFLFNNYKQAHSIIYVYSPELEAFKAVYGFGAADFEQWHHEESEWLASQCKEPAEDMLKVLYVEALERLRTAK